MILGAVLIATCLVGGRVTAPSGAPLAGVEVVHEPTGVVLAVTAPDGSFDLQTPDAPDDQAVLQFRPADRDPVVRRVPCNRRVDVEIAPREGRMEVLEVSATRLQRTTESSPATVESLDERAVLEAAASSPSLAQAVQQLPGVGAVGRDGFTSAPTIRGLGRDRSLILLEGVRLSSDRGVGPTGSFLDPFLLRKVDVVRGASGVAYGSGAIGGVISVGLGPVEARRHASARVSGATNGDGLLVAGRAGDEVGRGWRASAGGFLRSQKDYSFPGDGPLSEGDAANSGLENGGGVLALEREMGGGGLRLAFVGTSADDVGRPTTRGGRLDTIETEDHVLMSARWSRDRSGRRTEAAVGFHRPRTVNRGERFDDTGAWIRTTLTENESWDVSVATLVGLPWGRGSWLAGLDLFARRGVDATETTVRPVVTAMGPATDTTVLLAVQDGSRLDAGLFAGTKRPIGSGGEVLIAARLDWARRDANDRSVADWIAPSANVGLVYPLSRSWTAVASAARSFRAPRIQELYFAGDRPGGSRLANPDLEPETAWSAEAGVRWAEGGWSTSAVLFGLRADDLIVQLPVDAAGDTLRNENETEARIGGVELGIGWEDAAGRGRASADYALIGGENEDGDPLPDIPSGELRLTGEWRAVSTPSGREATVRLAMRAGAAKTPIVGGQDERWYSDLLGSTGTGGDEEGHGGFARWDAGVRVRVNPLAVVDVSVSNLLDSRYLDRPEAGAFPQPGRSLLVELTLGE